ncbi:MAG: AMP-binding protein [Candidatus Anammoxibacter sp.]
MDKHKITIGDLLDKIANKYPDRDALVYVNPPLKYNYKGFRDICNKAAKGLLKLGVKKGDHLSIWANNVPEWVIVQFASAKIGAILVTVNTNYKTFELEYLLKQSDTKHLILIGGIKKKEYLDMIYELCPELHKTADQDKLNSIRLPLLKNVIYLGDEKMDGMFNWKDILAMSDTISDEDLRDRQTSLDPDDVINMQYTSGTTGFPKGVMLTHTNLIGNAYSISECLNFTEKDRLCIPVPFFHCFGCVLGTLTCVVSGAAMVPLVSYNPKEVLKTVEKEKCTALHGVPTMFIAELEEMSADNYNVSSLRTGIMAGATCPIEVMKSVCNVLGISEICITYGLTEASPAITMTRTNDPIELRVNTVGQAIPNVEVKIVDENTGEIVEPGEQGEMCTKGYHVMKGYYNMPKETALAIDENDWLHTGDLAIMDTNGFYSITGRLKDMIIRGGENIYPREIEEFLYSFHKIKNVQVVGVQSKKYGEEVAAFIQLKEGETSTEEYIKDYCKDKISKHKVPEFIFFVDDYPTTASGKVKKYKLREIANAKLENSNKSYK